MAKNDKKSAGKPPAKDEKDEQQETQPQQLVGADVTAKSDAAAAPEDLSTGDGAAPELSESTQPGAGEDPKPAKDDKVAEPAKAAVAASGSDSATDEVVIQVPKRFQLNLPTGKSILFSPGPMRVPRYVAEHPYVKANGCKVI